MYEIIYKYKGNRKSAFVCACAGDDAETILLEQFLDGDIVIESTRQVPPGCVIYPYGRF